MVTRLTSLVLLLALTAPAAAAPRKPLIIAHRGASGHRPEHTLEAYRLAIDMGADFIEPDLVSTKDGALVARHENEIGATTDVELRFPDRRRTKTIDGQSLTGWFIEDFTLAELRTLRAKERLAFRSHAWDGQFLIPTFDEVLGLAEQMSQKTGRTIGVYPETKHPSYFRSLGLPIEEPLLAALEKRGWRDATAPVFIQSFEVANLRWLRERTRLRLIQLLDAQRGLAMTTDAGLAAIRVYTDGIGPNTRLVIPTGPGGALQPPSDLVSRAHAAGLLVHVWTLRREPEFLHPSYGGDPAREFRQFADLGVDGIFTDFPDVGATELRRIVR